MTDGKIVDLVRRRLLGESERTQEPLKRVKVDEVYFRYGITPDQASMLEQELAVVGVLIEDDDGSEYDGPAEPAATGGQAFVDALSHLMYQVKRLPRLSRQDEQLLGEAIQLGIRTASEDDLAASAYHLRILKRAEDSRGKLVSHNIRLVVKLVMDRRFRSRMDADDLVQHGMLGLIRAAEKYDPDWGTRFSTYATWWIRQAVSRGIHSDGHTIRLPEHVITHVNRLRRAKRLLNLAGDGRGDISRLAESLAWTVEFTARIAQVAEMSIVSLDAPLSGEVSDGMKIGDLVADAMNRPDQAAELQRTKEMVRDLVEGIDNDRARDIVKRRFGFDGPDETLQDVGDDYGVTRERIRQIEAKTLGKLEKRAIAQGLRSDSF